MTRTIFVDTSAWIGLFARDDQWHPQARQFWQELPRQVVQLVTSEYVLSETYTHLRRRRKGLQRAILFHDTIYAAPMIDILDIDRPLRAKAWTIFTGYQDKVLSFVDCTSFALMQTLSIIEAFAFDEHFTRLGFVTVPQR
ncbi:MAG: type II toxin-antitoxin system VapC family toxin [Anaerolineae bacterium]